MIPLKLQLRNFMCYRDGVPPLSFDAIHLACLCGDNGSGKSALLDAMTWAIWGKSRAESDDELVHQGQNDMEVDFEFGAQGQTYRVVRKHSRGTATRSGATLLTLQALSNGSYNDISGNTKTETQQKIVELLRLDYKTFINSAYLVQGRANEFTVADPAERKRVLAAILDLSQYDELAELARTKATEKGNLALRLQDLIAGFDSELAGKPQCQADLAELLAARAKVQLDRARADADLTTLRKELQEAEIKQQQARDLERRTAELRADIGRWTSSVEELARRIADYEKIESERQVIESGQARFLSLEAENNLLSEKARQLLTLNAAINRLELAIERAQNALVNEHRTLQKKLDDERKKADSLTSLQTEAATTRAGLAALAAIEEKLSGKRQHVATLLNHAENLKTQTIRLSDELKQIEGKLAMLAERGARCPLCDTELGEGGVERVRSSYQAERTARAQGIKSNTLEIEKTIMERRALETEISREEPAVKSDRAARLGKLGRLESEITSAQEALAALDKDSQELVILEKRLAARDFAQTEQKALLELQGQVSALGYDEARHRDVRRLLDEASQFQRKSLLLEEALKRLPQVREELSSVEATISDLQVLIGGEEERSRVLLAESSDLPSLAGRVRETEAACKALAQSENAFNEQIAVAQERLGRCERLERDRSAKKAELSFALEEEAVFRQLSDAFGKKGIQALLIEQALPKIQDEADRLLKRLTDNRMSIAINTQKGTKKGTVIETLDIQVGDEFGGTRKYEMFSGGEAFRIDFALRIALSRLLTHRAGASLSTLFIDEGFGTQDASGRDRLVEVINSIQDEFEKIIVITHLEELKEAFPTRIEVTRTPQGSAISVI